jgi:hypothetical protein
MRTPTYLGLEKSCGRSLGPSGAFALPRSAGLFMAGGGRAADMALEALVLRRRLPLSVVFWNLRTRSSAAAHQHSDAIACLRWAYLTSHSTLTPTHSTRTAQGDRSCPWCGFLSARVPTSTRLAECCSRTAGAAMADSHLPRVCRARRQLPSVELGRHLRLCGHLVWDSLAAVSGVATSPGNGQQRIGWAAMIKDAWAPRVVLCSRRPPQAECRGCRE